MCQGYVKWLEAHPNATDKERKEAWEKQLMLLEVQNYVSKILLLCRN